MSTDTPPDVPVDVPVDDVPLVDVPLDALPGVSTAVTWSTPTVVPFASISRGPLSVSFSPTTTPVTSPPPLSAVAVICLPIIPWPATVRCHETRSVCALPSPPRAA